MLNEQCLFSDGEEGKRLWEAGIVLSRFLAENPELLKGKSVLEVGSGCGVAGISAAKLCKPARVVLTDYTEEVLDLL